MIEVHRFRDTVEAYSVDSIVAHYNWLTKYISRYNNSEDRIIKVEISGLSNHYEFKRDIIENWDRDNWNNKIKDNFSTNILDGNFVTYKANYDLIFYISSEENEYRYKDVEDYQIDLNLFINEEDWFDDYPDGLIGGFNKTEKGNKLQLINAWKFEKVCDGDFEKSIDDIPDPSNEEFLDYKKKLSREAEAIKLRNIKSWEGFEHEISK